MLESIHALANEGLAAAAWMTRAGSAGSLLEPKLRQARLP